MKSINCIWKLLSETKQEYYGLDNNRKKWTNINKSVHLLQLKNKKG